MKVTVLIRPKEGIRDPQGTAVRLGLEQLGFAVSNARVGRIIDLELEDVPADEVTGAVERMCEQLLANPLIESYELLVPECVVAAATTHEPSRGTAG